MDIRLIAASSSVALAIIGYIVLTMTNHATQAEDLLTLIALPSLTWILGVGSSLVKKTDK